MLCLTAFPGLLKSSGICNRDIEIPGIPDQPIVLFSLSSCSERDQTIMFMINTYISRREIGLLDYK